MPRLLRLHRLVLFNAHAPELWRPFTITLPRTLARRAGLTGKAFAAQARLSYAKVAEYQRRGVDHFHAIVRLDGSAGPATAPPAWATLGLLTDAIGQAARAVRVQTPAARRVPSRTLAWGSQLDIRPVTPRTAGPCRRCPGTASSSTTGRVRAVSAGRSGRMAAWRRYRRGFKRPGRREDDTLIIPRGLVGTLQKLAANRGDSPDAPPVADLQAGHRAGVQAEGRRIALSAASVTQPRRVQDVPRRPGDAGQAAASGDPNRWHGFMCARHGVHPAEVVRLLPPEVVRLLPGHVTRLTLRLPALHLHARAGCLRPGRRTRMLRLVHGVCRGSATVHGVGGLPWGHPGVIAMGPGHRGGPMGHVHGLAANGRLPWPAFEPVARRLQEQLPRLG